MTTTQNPTPVYGPPEPDIDAINAEDQANNGMDVEPVPDGQGGWVDDNTGMHPTATTYATTVVGTATSPQYPTQYATPTPATYHIDWSDDQVLSYNQYVGDNSLTFIDGSREWSDYTHSRDYSNGGFLNTQPNKSPWVEGFVVRYSWNFISRLTGNEYDSVCPAVIYFDNSSTSRTLYYFFEEVFNDFQARFGYANYDYSLDGKPKVTWPGMVKVVRSVIGSSQRPIERDRYETWFVNKFGRLDYAAPYMYQVPNNDPSGPGRPTRFRLAADPTPTRTPRDVADTVAFNPTDETVSVAGVDDDMDEDDEGEDTAEVAALRAAAASKS